MEHVLVIGGGTDACARAQSAFDRDSGYRVSRAASLDETLPVLDGDPPSLAVVDAALGDAWGIEAAREALQRDIPVLLMTDEPELEAQLARLGFDCMQTPFRLEDLLARSRQLIAAAAENQVRLRASLAQMRARLDELRRVIAQSRAIMRRARADRAARAPAGDAAKYDYRADPILREALGYWEKIRGRRAMPQRRDLDPTELSHWVLPHLQLTEVVDGGLRFRYRLVGTAISDAFGAEFTGKHVDELIAGERLAFVHGFYGTVCVMRKPVFVRSRYITTKASGLAANRLLLPLSEDGQQVNVILGALTFASAGPPRRGEGHAAAIDLGASSIEILP